MMTGKHMRKEAEVMSLADICSAIPWGALRTTEVEWKLLSEPQTAGRKEIHVWRAWLHIDRSRCDALACVLDRDEKEKAERCRSPLDRRRYIAAHGMLRVLLASYLGAPPESIAYRRSEGGKPVLALSDSGTSFGFNMAHSRDLALFAVGECGDLGVDVEYVSGTPDIEELGRACLSACEREALSSLPEGDRREALYRWWTRKEATAKATGEGLAASFERLPVIPPYLARAPLREGGESAPGGDGWSVWDLTPWPGYVGALASPGERMQPRLFDWRGSVASSGMDGTSGDVEFPFPEIDAHPGVSVTGRDGA